jgi:hypothetical protein
MSQDEIVAFLSAHDARSVFVFRFTDGTEMELTDPCVTIVDGRYECIATVVREVPGVEAAAGSGLSFALHDVTEVRLSRRPFEYFR